MDESQTPVEDKGRRDVGAAVGDGQQSHLSTATTRLNDGDAGMSSRVVVSEDHRGEGYGEVPAPAEGVVERPATGAAAPPPVRSEEVVEPTSRDVLFGPGSTGHVMNELLYDMIRLEGILWKLFERPVPTELPQVLQDVCQKIMNVLQKGKPLELAGLKDVPRPFLRSQGRFLAVSSTGVFSVMDDQMVLDALAGLLMEELKKETVGFSLSDSPYKELKDLMERSIHGSSVVLVPDPKDAILLRRGASNADKLYESHMGNKVVFNVISQLVTTCTITCGARVEAALNLLSGLQDAFAAASMASPPMDMETQLSTPLGAMGDTPGVASTPTPSVPTAPAATPAESGNHTAANSNSKARFLLRNIREDESVFWSVLDPSDAALFALCFVFEVFLEKEIHLQLPQQPSIVVKDADPDLMEHSTTVPVENPLDYDVLFGRGGMTNSHPGNRRFRDVIALHRPDYIRALKMDKPTVARKIVKAIRRSGRFLKKGDDGKWYDVGDRTAAEKTSQGLRERSNSEKRQRSALREAMQTRRQDMNDESNDDEKTDESPEQGATKKQKTDSAGVRVSPNVSTLHYVGTNLALPLSLGMKDLTGSGSVPRKKSSSTPVSGRTNSSVELFTEGLPPNAVDEDGNILVTDFDILCGRGGLTNHHKGNKRFRDIVALHRADYVRAPKIQKPSVARVIVRAIRNGEPPGRFLRKDDKTGKWVDIGDKKAAEKTSQALREKTSDEQANFGGDVGALVPDTGVLLPSPSSFLIPPPASYYIPEASTPVESETKEPPTTDAIEASYGAEGSKAPADEYSQTAGAGVPSKEEITILGAIASEQDKPDLTSERLSLKADAAEKETEKTKIDDAVVVKVEERFGEVPQLERSPTDHEANTTVMVTGDGSGLVADAASDQTPGPELEGVRATDERNESKYSMMLDTFEV